MTMLQYYKNKPILAFTMCAMLFFEQITATISQLTSTTAGTEPTVHSSILEEMNSQSCEPFTCRKNCCSTEGICPIHSSSCEYFKCENWMCESNSYCLKGICSSENTTTWIYRLVASLFSLLCICILLFFQESIKSTTAFLIKQPAAAIVATAAASPKTEPTNNVKELTIKENGKNIPQIPNYQDSICQNKGVNESYAQSILNISKSYSEQFIDLNAYHTPQFALITSSKNHFKPKMQEMNNEHNNMQSSSSPRSSNSSNSELIDSSLQTAKFTQPLQLPFIFAKKKFSR